jgi:hypothetical protein
MVISAFPKESGIPRIGADSEGIDICFLFIADEGSCRGGPGR